MCLLPSFKKMMPSYYTFGPEWGKQIDLLDILPSIQPHLTILYIKALFHYKPFRHKKKKTE